MLIVRINVKSCLNSKSLDQAMKDLVELRERQDRNDELNKEYDAKVQEQADKEEPEDIPKPTLEDVSEKEYLTETREMALVVDTLGQDRILTEKQQGVATRWGRALIDCWEQCEIFLLNDSTR